MSQFIKTVFLFFVISSCSKEISETTSVETEEPEVIEGSTLPLITTLSIHMNQSILLFHYPRDF